MGSVEEEAEEGEEAAGTGDETKQNEETSTTEWRPVKSGNDTYYLNNTGETSWNLPTCPEDIVDEKRTKSGGDFKSAKALHLHNMYTVDGERRLDTNTDTAGIDGVSMVVLGGGDAETALDDEGGQKAVSTTAPPTAGAESAGATTSGPIVRGSSIVDPKVKVKCEGLPTPVSMADRSPPIALPPAVLPASSPPVLIIFSHTGLCVVPLALHCAPAMYYMYDTYTSHRSS